MSNKTISARGMTFACSVGGKPGAQWVVMSNSLGTNLTLWDSLAAELEADFRTFRYDQRGHGGTSAPPAPYHMAELARDVIALMDAERIERAHYVGISMGGATGWGLAQIAPRRLRSLTVCNSITKSTSAAAWNDRLKLIEGEGLAALVEPTLARWFTPESMRKDAASIGAVRTMLRTTSEEGFIGCVNALQDFDFDAGVAKIALRVLLVAGECDGDKPESMAADAKRIPDAKFAIVPGSGHLCNIESPEPFNAIVGEFLRRAATDDVSASLVADPVQ